MKLENKILTATVTGCISKGWYQRDGKSFLVKGNLFENNRFGCEPFSEVLACRLGKLLGLDVVEYWLEDSKKYPDIKTKNCDYVSVCEKMKIKGQLISYARWADTVAGKAVKDYWSFYLKSGLSVTDLARMLVFDAIIGNCDRHLNNFEIVVSSAGTSLSPIFDNGASLLATKMDSELKMSKGVGFDVSKPFKQTHEKQIALLKRTVRDVKLFAVNPEQVYEEWVQDCEDIFRLLPAKRTACIEHYVKNRLVYLDWCNETKGVG